MSDKKAYKAAHASKGAAGGKGLKVIKQGIMRRFKSDPEKSTEK